MTGHPARQLVDDRDLIAGTLAGRRADFEALVERYQRMVYAFVYRSLQDRDATDDVVQETFVQAYRHLARFRGEASFKTWLHQIALNLCRARFRASRIRREVSLDDVPESALPPAEPNPMASAELTLKRHVAQLPPRQRSVLTLRVYGDLSFKEIAHIEGISENSAKVSFHHAITRLKQWLARES